MIFYLLLWIFVKKKKNFLLESWFSIKKKKNNNVILKITVNNYVLILTIHRSQRRTDAVIFHTLLESPQTEEMNGTHGLRKNINNNSLILQRINLKKTSRKIWGYKFRLALMIFIKKILSIKSCLKFISSGEFC